MLMSHKEFSASIIAQDDDNDYDEGGWVVCRVGDTIYMARYSHCSCYGTWEAIGGDEWNDTKQSSPQWDWEGSIVDFLAMADTKADPTMPERVADPKDYDYDHLIAVYEQASKVLRS